MFMIDELRLIHTYYYHYLYLLLFSVFWERAGRRHGRVTRHVQEVWAMRLGPLHPRLIAQKNIQIHEKYLVSALSPIKKKGIYILSGNNNFAPAVPVLVVTCAAWPGTPSNRTPLCSTAGQRRLPDTGDLYEHAINSRIVLFKEHYDEQSCHLSLIFLGQKLILTRQQQKLSMLKIGTQIVSMRGPSFFENKVSELYLCLFKTSLFSDW